MEYTDEGKPKWDANAERMLKWFTYEHLPPALREASQPFCVLAKCVCHDYPPGPERTVGLRKLLEAKDCIVRAAIGE